MKVKKYKTKLKHAQNITYVYHSAVVVGDINLLRVGEFQIKFFVF